LKTSNVPNQLTSIEYSKEIKKIPREMITSNTKLKKDSIGVFSIPALYGTVVGDSGILQDLTTCPNAGVCSRFCYAQKGMYSFPKTKVSQNKKLQFLLDAMKDPKKLEIFQAIIYSDILRNNYKTIRIHDSGDFFSVQYARFIFKHLVQKFPKIQFYAYTKMVPMFEVLRKKNQIPKNLKIIYSEGGKHDSMINQKHPHSRIFKTKEDLLNAGYIDCSSSDLPTSIKGNVKIGLIYH
jgi:hypothetical protein